MGIHALFFKGKALGKSGFYAEKQVLRRAVF
jgi:hypothetical protein